MNETLSIILNETLKKLETLHNSRSDLSKQLDAVEEKLKTAGSPETDAAKVLELEELKYVILICISENDNAFFSAYSSALRSAMTEFEAMQRNSILLNNSTLQLKEIYRGYLQILQTKPSCPHIEKLH